MNFISHYYCNIARPDIYKVACFLPDIFPKFSYQRNQLLKRLDTSIYSEDELKVWEGIQRHYRDDNIFHSLDSFKNNVSFISDLMKKDEVLNTIKRKFIVAHVLYELILDNILVEKVDGIIEDIYDDVAKFDEKLMISFLEKTFNKKEIRELYLSRYHKFQEQKFLYFYTKEENLVKALSKVTGEMGGYKFEEPIISRFISVIQKSKAQINLRESLV